MFSAFVHGEEEEEEEEEEEGREIHRKRDRLVSVKEPNVSFFSSSFDFSEVLNSPR